MREVSFSTAASDRWFEDYEVGGTYQLGSFSLSEAEIVEFAQRFEHEFSTLRVLTKDQSTLIQKFFATSLKKQGYISSPEQVFIGMCITQNGYMPCPLPILRNDWFHISLMDYLAPISKRVLLES